MNSRFLKWVKNSVELILLNLNWNREFIRRFVSVLVVWVFLCASAFAYSFVVFGDNRDGDEVFKDLIARVNQEKGIVFAVNTGDLVSNGSAQQYETYRKMTSRLKVPVYNVLGNHDGVRGGWKIFQKYFGLLYYSFDYQDSHFIILNNAFRESFDSAQFAWLKKDIANSQAKHKFVFMHKPVFDPSEIYEHYVMSGRAVTEELARLFEKYKVNYVFAGHIHGYAKAERNGVVYIVTAGAGAPLYLPPEFGGFYHYVRMGVDNGKIRDQVVRVYE